MDALEILGSLVQSIELSKSERPKQNGQVPRQSHNTGDGQYIVKSGDGGLIMNFGDKTGCAFVDNWNKMLQGNADPVQLKTANYQEQSFQKALESYVELGEDKFTRNLQVQEQVAKEEGHRAYEEIKKSYESKSLVVGGKKITATSETDQAIMDMFENSELE
jgi:hypothetical protein